nr:immunoglobulin light chain junction region [Macaca mulatta]
DYYCMICHNNAWVF